MYDPHIAGGVDGDVTTVRKESVGRREHRPCSVAVPEDAGGRDVTSGAPVELIAPDPHRSVGSDGEVADDVAGETVTDTEAAPLAVEAEHSIGPRRRPDGAGGVNGKRPGPGLRGALFGHVKGCCSAGVNPDQSVGATGCHPERPVRADRDVPDRRENVGVDGVVADQRPASVVVCQPGVAHRPDGPVRTHCHLGDASSTQPVRFSEHGG